MDRVSQLPDVPGRRKHDPGHQPSGGREMVEENPTVRQRELSIRLRRLREENSLTVGEVAEQLLCSAAKVSRIETGARRVSLRDVRDLCQIYGVGDQEAAQLMDLARRARENGWWAHYDDLGVGPYFDLEQE